MSDAQLQFQNRLRHLERKHHKTATRGYSTKMRADGLIVVKPNRAKSRISGKSVLLFVAAFILFKGEMRQIRICRISRGKPRFQRRPDAVL